MTIRPIVVGIDGSPSSLAAAHFAAGLAVRRGLPLHLLYGYEIPMYGYLPIGVADRYAVNDPRTREDLGSLLEATAKQVRTDHPGLAAVEAQVHAGSGAAVLIEASRSAAVTVVGCRGVGGFAGLMQGSVSSQVSTHGHGPIVVVRRDVSSGGPVVVGVDRSPASEAAVRFAVDEAAGRGVVLLAVHAYRDEGGENDTVLAEELLAERVLTQVPASLDVELRALRVPSVEKAMIEVTRGAGLAVVGCRGTGGFAGLLLGSVSQSLVHHAHAPVAVIHPAED